MQESIIVVYIEELSKLQERILKDLEENAKS